MSAPCVICNVNIPDGVKSMECDLCHMLCHQSCNSTEHFTDLTHKAVRTAQKLKTGDLAWYCPVCRPDKDKIISAYRDVNILKADSEKRFADLEASFKKLETIVTSKVSMTATNAFLSGRDIQGEIVEALDRQKKKLNLVIVGLPESDISSKVCAADRKFVDDVCGGLNLNTDSISEVFRDGMIPAGKPSYSRIVKVKFKDSASRLHFLQNFRKAKPTSTVFRATYVRPDMTYRERQADKALTEELKAKRLADPGTDYIIRRGVVIPRPGNERRPGA